MNIEQTVTDIFRSIFQDQTIEIHREMTAAEVERWDSLSHVEMIASVEKTFGIKFKLKEVMKMKNVGDLLDTIAAHLATK